MSEVSMSTSPPPKKPRRRRAFTPEFKAEAVRLATQPGRSIRQVAKELDLSESCLSDWVKQAKVNQRSSSTGPLTTDERAELAQLRRELRAAQEERDFLKKAAAYFAKDRS
jgi:transposase